MARRTSGVVVARPAVDGHDRRRFGEPVGGQHRQAELVVERRTDDLGAVGATGPDLVEAGQVVRADGVGVGEGVEEGGRTVPGGDPLLTDPLGHAVGVDAVHQDRGAAGLRHQQRGEHRQVEDGEREAVALAQLGPVAAGRDQHGTGQQQVVLAVHRALRAAGGAAGVGDAGRRVRVDVDVHRSVVGCVDGGAPVVRGGPQACPRRRVGSSLRQDRGAAVGRAANASRVGPALRLTPTHTAPRRMAPWKAATMSTSLGSDAATRSPVRMPEVGAARGRHGSADGRARRS